ncbi:MAG: methylmalonyl Co-A mutase-associated GTPase MeaB [Clostridia bacterium]|jgi:LAO/AO transport system kinase|nr:methylmalonyl Co-A mutase-associated GTPase MeaB [Clostridia bacterium]
MLILAEEIMQGNRRSLAKAITLIENEEIDKEGLLARLYPLTGKARIIGVTGPPGAGKSSLVDCLTREFRSQGLKVGIIAVDPTSPFSGGALLGDRIRMQEHALDPGVFIRSMGTRGSLGGLSRATKEAVILFDAFGFQIILIETVGVGQSELDIMHAADTVLVVMSPGGGDVVQTMKAGIMEIADIFVINKADLDGADRTAEELETTLDLAGGQEWKPPVVKTISLNGDGIQELVHLIYAHACYLEDSGLLQKMRGKRLHEEVMEIVMQRLQQNVFRRFRLEEQFQELLTNVATRNIDPYTAARKILRELEGRELSQLS